MIWLERPPWKRWLLATVLALISIWVEVRPDPTVDHPFASTDLEAGDTIGAHNTEMRSVPSGLFRALSGNVAADRISEGDPVLATAVAAQSSSVPTGWWVISAELPVTARRGDEVQVVVLDSGQVISGVVAESDDSDPFSDSTGSIAVDPTAAADVARAVASGRVSVMLSSG